MSNIYRRHSDDRTHLIIKRLTPLTLILCRGVIEQTSNRLKKEYTANISDAIHRRKIKMSADIKGILKRN